MKTETLVIASCLGLMFWVLFGIVVFASGNDNNSHDITITVEPTPVVINNYYDSADPGSVGTQSIETMTITNGISSDDLAKGVATAMAAGGHQFDYSTQSWQGSVNAAFQVSGENENNVSFGVGKRWDQMDALFHMSYTPNSSDDWVTVGGTFRF